MGSRVYAGKLPHDTRERDLERFFEGFGRINEILLRRGYAFVEFDDFRDAEDAIHELNGAKLLGQRIVVEATRRPPRFGGPIGRSKPPPRSKHRLIVENLSSRIDWRELKACMRKAGNVTFADAHRDRTNEGVVEFANRYDMKKAIKMFDDTELNGRYIRLYEDRGRSRSRSRSISRSRSRSVSRPRSVSRSRSRSRGYQSKSRSSNRRSKSRSVSESRSRSRSRSESKHTSRSDRSERSSGRSSRRTERS